MELNQIIKSKALTGEINIADSAALPLFWAVAAFLTEGDLLLKNARSEHEPLSFLLKFQKLDIPFEVKGEDLRVWYTDLSDKPEAIFENSFQLQMVPLFLKLPFKVTITNIADDLRSPLSAFIKEAKRVGAKIRLRQSGILETSPSRIRSSRFLFTQDQEFDQALLLLALLSSGKSTLLSVAASHDWLQPFLVD